MRTIDIFEIKVKNQIKILKSIYDNSGNVNLKKISEDTLMDVKTVNNMWYELSSFIRAIDDLSRMDVYLSMRIKVFRSSWVYNLCEKLLLGYDIPLANFLIDNFLSKSKVQRKIRKINQLLELTSVKIVSRKGFLKIEGSEVQIRFLAQQFFWTIYKGIEWPFSGIEFNGLFNFFSNEVFKNLEPRIKDVTHVEFCFSFAISLTRMQNEYKIKKNQLPDYILNYSNYFESHRVQEVAELLKINYRLNQEEVLYFWLLVQMHPDFYLNESFYEKSLKIYCDNDTDIYTIYKEMMSFLDSNTTFRSGRHFAEATVLSAIVSAKTVHGFYRPISGYDMEDFFNMMAPNLLKKMKKVIENIQKKYPNISLLNEKEYLSIRFAESYSLVANMLDFEEKILVGIITDLNISLEELMVRKLKRRFYLIDNLEFVTINQSEYKKYDIVIKTSITLGDMSVRGEDVVIVDPILNIKDINQISDAIYRARSQKIVI